MYHYCLFIFFCFFLVIGSCNVDNQNTRLNVLTLDFKEQGSDPYDLLATNYIKLKADEKLIEESIIQVDYALNKIFILTEGPDAYLSAFDLSGNFISQIGSRGKEKGQFVMANSFSIDEEAGLRSIVDFVQKKVVNYSLYSYNFISEINLPIRSTSFEYLDDKQYLIKNVDDDPNHQEWEFLLSNREMAVTNTYIKKISSLPQNFKKTIYKSQGNIHAYAQLNPIVYSFNDNKFEPVYNLRFGNFELPPKEYLDKLSDKKEGALKTLRNSEYISHYDILETGNILNTYYTVSNQHFLGLYNKRSGETLRFTTKIFEDKMKIGSMSKPVGRINEFIVATLLSSDLRNKRNTGYDLDPELECLLDHESTDNSPILFLYKFKI